MSIEQLTADEQAATEVMSLAEQQLAAANALLEYMATEAPDTAIGEATMRLIRAHLSAQPVAPTDHDRAVLDAMAAVPVQNLSVMLRGGQCALKGLPEAASAELARREAKR